MKRLAGLYVSIAVLSMLSTCSSRTTPSASAPGTQTPPVDAAREEPEPEDVSESWARATLETLSLEQKIGQMIFPRSDGSFASESDPELSKLMDSSREGRIGGVVFFRGDPLSTAALTNRLQEVSRLPLLMASDYEWGPGMRVLGASRFPRAMAIGAGGRVEDMELQAEVTAREARALGIHLLLNPVLDLNTNRDNSVITTRSFGEDADTAAKLGVKFIERAQSLGVLTTAKHFPGHGATEQDSHFDLPVLKKSREELLKVELAPFRAAIEAGVAAVMPAHIGVPAFDSGRERPATISPNVLKGLLREELGFEGMIVSDALDMGALNGTASPGELAVLAVAAGVDALLVPPEPLVVYRALLRAAKRGDLSESRIDESVLRILAAKERLELHKRRTVNLRDVPLRLAHPRTLERIDEIAQRGVTVIRNEDDALPFATEAPPSILLVEYLYGTPPTREMEMDSRARVLREELERRTARVRRVRVRRHGEAHARSAIAPRPDEVVVFASYASARFPRNAGDPAASLVTHLRELAASGTKTVFVAFGNPYVLTSVPQASALVAAYDASEASQRAVARALFGESRIDGRLPVALSAEYPLGHGIDIEARRMTLERERDPRAVGFSRRRLRAVTEVVRDGVAAGATPGAVFLVARRGRIVLDGAIGKSAYDSDAAAVSRDTMYDLASLTKVVVTTTLAMIFYERGDLDLGAPVSMYVPEFRGGEKETVTVRDLLSHSGGLLWWTDLYRRFEGLSSEKARQGYLDTIYELPLEYPPRSKMVYSDLGVLLLGEILERVSGRGLGELARGEIFEPLGMDETMYRPSPSLRDRIAPTEIDEWRGGLVHGEVHDENAYGLGGVAAHAGLFSTARSLASFAQMLLNGGAYGDRRLLSADTIRLFTRRSSLVEGSSRALGWDTPSDQSSAGEYFSSSSFGHTGFTGTSLWIDPERELFAILLTNRVHPTRENSKITQLRPAFHNAILQAIDDAAVEARVTQSGAGRDGVNPDS